MNVSKITLILLATCCLGACKNDIEINAPWQEIPIVYGFLDVNNDTQYIRLQKAYQNSVDLTTAEGAQISDSLYFKNATVQVNGVTFTKITSIPKNSGLFASDVNFVYQAYMPINAGMQYTLDVKSNETGKTYTALTTIVGQADIMSISPNYKIYVRPHQDFNRIQFQFKPGAKAALYDVAIRFWYKEYATGNPSGFELKFIDYFLERNWTVNSQSGKSYVPRSREFINYLKNAIPQKTGITREFHQIDYIATGGSKEMKDIIDLSKPSAVIVQRKTDYSNINGGLGIFSSRSETVKANIPLQNDNDDNGVDSSKIYLVKDLPNFIY